MQQLFPQVAGCNGNSGCTACRDCSVYQGCCLGLGQDHYKLVKEYWFVPTFCWSLLWGLILHVLSFLHLPPNLVVMGEWLYFGDLEARQCVWWEQQQCWVSQRTLRYKLSRRSFICCQLTAVIHLVSAGPEPWSAFLGQWFGWPRAARNMLYWHSETNVSWGERILACPVKRE